MARLQPGSPAPDVRLQADDGSTVAPSDLRGQTVVLYFYPKDASPGCTTQACEFRDLEADYAAAGARVLGVSPDPVESHARFRERNGLPFTLLSDPDHVAAEAYGVWVEKARGGRRYMGVERSTFVIGPDGRVKEALYGVRASGSAAEALAAVGGG